MNLKRILNILSGTDDAIIDVVPLSAQRKRAGWAYMLLFTTVLSFGGAFHFVLAMFIEKSSSEVTIPIYGHIIAFLIAFAYSGGMALFSVDTMSSSNKAYALLRLPISIITSVLIALPLTLLVFSDSIYQKIDENIKSKLEKMITSSTPSDTSIKKSIAILQKEINDLSTFKNTLMKEASEKSMLAHNEEIGKGIGNTIAKCGPRCKEFKREKQDALVKISQIESEIQNKFDNIGLLRKQDRDENAKKATRKQAYSSELNAVQSHDILAQMNALEELMAENSIVFIVVVLVVSTVMILDLTPAIVKLFSEQNEYDLLYTHRTSLNKSKLTAMFQHYKHQLEKGQSTIDAVSNMKQLIEK